MNDRQPIGLAPVRGYLRYKLTVAHTCRCGKSRCLIDALFDFFCNIHRQFNAFLVFCYIEKGFVEGYGFYEVGIFVEYLVQMCRYFFLSLEMGLYDDEFWT